MFCPGARSAQLRMRALPVARCWSALCADGHSRRNARPGLRDIIHCRRRIVVRESPVQTGMLSALAGKYHRDAG